MVPTWVFEYNHCQMAEQKSDSDEQKSDTDEQNSEAAKARIVAETRKLRAEALKLRAEARDLNRTPWQRPGIWVGLGSALVALVAGLIAIPFQVLTRMKTIADQQKTISEQQAEISQQKEELSNEAVLKAQQDLTKAQQDALKAKQEIEVKERQGKELNDQIAQIKLEENAANSRLTQQQAALNVVIQRRKEEEQAVLGQLKEADFFTLHFLPPGLPLTALSRPGALRAIAAPSLLVFPMPLEQSVSYVGLVNDDRRVLLAVRCRPPDPEVLRAVPATWPNVFAAIQQDVPLAPGECDAMPPNPDKQAACFAHAYTDPPMTVVPHSLAHTFEYADTVFDAEHPVLRQWLQEHYGIYPAFSGLGRSVKDSYFLDKQPMNSAVNTRKFHCA